ncbi:DUF2236 domain-containing protein [Flagellatimonas centrodinii]|uniref:oxygenase MpaB family protein n=1 Tax=Flagellatimonas centrodinii TaxID=2806210 RepID=UPI001FEEC607|nr:oxygenase MpaB family protein [Flagellatimonas centrodinii]ULQ47529.1 DUF2236 domain-containing protein [Flagellatimonas centrodinii]
MNAPVQPHAHAQPLPRRHGADLSTGRRMAGPLRWLIRGDPTPSPAQWQAVGESLLQGDPAADALVAWMGEVGMATSKPLFDRAACDGIGQLDAPPAPLRQFFATVETVPAWVDPVRLDAGARACGLSGLTGMRVLRDFGLMAGYQAAAINRTLVMTGALSKGAQKRVAETTKWWIDCTRPGGMAVGAPGYVSTLQVRLIHALVRRHLVARPDWDSTAHGLPINQGDMHATYLAFSVIFLMGQRLLGVPITAAEGADVMHLWRYIGWLMGVDDRWLHHDEQSGRIALYHNLLAQAPPDATSRELGRALMDEPLGRHYQRFGWLQGRFNRARHLSIARTFLGRAGMRALGLPPTVLPWYPVLTTAPRWLLMQLLRQLPGGAERLSQHGLNAQAAYLPVLFGGDDPRLRDAVGVEAVPSVEQ